METTGRVKDISRDWKTGKPVVSFLVDHLGDAESLGGELDITAQKHREKRSVNANALLWQCITKIARTLGADKWQIYLQMLKRYGEYTFVCVKPKAVEQLKKQWRETEEIGIISINGQTAVQLQCYYGSSTYDTKQFSVLLDGVISEMEEMGLETPEQEKVRLSLEKWEESTNGKKE